MQPLPQFGKAEEIEEVEESKVQSRNKLSMSKNSIELDMQVRRVDQTTQKGKLLEPEPIAEQL